jgi:hypothetical protein
MEDKFFLHRIRKDGDNFTAGIEVHDTLDAAIQSFHSQMKMAYNNPSYPSMKYVSCMVTDEKDEVVPGFNETWGAKNIQGFFVHYIRHDGGTYTKGIDACEDYATACRSFHTQMEYGHGNSRFPNITMVASKITGTSGYAHKSESWAKEETEE